MWTVHFLTFHQPHDFLRSGSTGWPSEGTGLSNIFKKSIIHALKIFWSNNSLGISNWINSTKPRIAYVNYVNLSREKHQNNWCNRQCYLNCKICALLSFILSPVTARSTKNNRNHDLFKYKHINQNWDLHGHCKVDYFFVFSTFYTINFALYLTWEETFTNHCYINYNVKNMLLKV